MKKVGFALLYFCLAILVFGILYFTSDAVLSRISGSKKVEQVSPRYDVYVLSNGVHTDLVFPVHTNIIDWMKIFPPSNNLSKDSVYKYVAIGWGDKGFYLNTPEWKDLKVSTALVAAFGLGETALHVTYYKTMKEDSLCYKVSIDSLQFVQLADYVLQTRDVDADGNSIVIQTTAQYGDTDSFYEAKGAYSMFHSCNTWANKGLKTANMPSALWTVFDKGILRHYKE